jgi:hypothetical protein
MVTTGFELSPHSTHMAVTGIKSQGKTQAGVNDENRGKLRHEMTKQNEYFRSFGIPVLTFTDQDLRDIPGIFNSIRAQLTARPERSLNLAGH